MVRESLVPPSNRRARASTEIPPTLRQLTFEEVSGLAGTRKFNEQVLKYYRKRAIGRKSTLIFAKDLKYVDNLTKVFVDAGIPAKSVTSRTSKTSRQEYIASFARGDCPVLVTCLALSEGFDAPQVSTNHGFERIRRADIDRSTVSSWQIPPTPGSFIPKWSAPPMIELIKDWQSYSSLPTDWQD
jgi:hypothetical protein